MCSKDRLPFTASISGGASDQSTTASPSPTPLTSSTPVEPSESSEWALPSLVLLLGVRGGPGVSHPVHSSFQAALLTLLWAQAAINSSSELTYAEFKNKFKCVFVKGVRSDAAAHRMFNLSQGKRRVADYSTDFWILVGETRSGACGAREGGNRTGGWWWVKKDQFLSFFWEIRHLHLILYVLQHHTHPGCRKTQSLTGQ